MMSECHITFPGPVSRTTLTQITIEYIKYILYYRGQFPLPLDQLKRNLCKNSEVSSHQSMNLKVDGHEIYYDASDSDKVILCRSSALINRTKQKFIEAVSNFDQFFNELFKILEGNNVKEIVLNLGPNMMNPKELYRITLPTRCSNPECALDYAPFQRCKSQFFQKVIQSDLWEDLKIDSVLPISVLLLLENEVMLNDSMERKGFYALPRNCKPRTVHFTGICNHASSLSSELEGLEKMSATDISSLNSIKSSGFWVKLKPDLRGIKPCSELA